MQLGAWRRRGVRAVQCGQDHCLTQRTAANGRQRAGERGRARCQAAQSQAGEMAARVLDDNSGMADSWCSWQSEKKRKTPPVALCCGRSVVDCGAVRRSGEFEQAVVPWLPLADGCTDCGVKGAVAPALGCPSQVLTSLSAAKSQCEREDGRLVFVSQLVSTNSAAVGISSIWCCQR